MYPFCNQSPSPGWENSGGSIANLKLEEEDRPMCWPGLLGWGNGRVMQTPRRNHAPEITLGMHRNGAHNSRKEATRHTTKRRFHPNIMGRELNDSTLVEGNSSSDPGSLNQSVSGSFISIWFAPLPGECIIVLQLSQNLILTLNLHPWICLQVFVS